MSPALPKLSFAVLFCVLLAAYFTSASAKNVSVTYVPETPTAEAELPKLSARAYGIFDVATGALLAAYNETEPLPIASVTKLFAAAAVFRALPLEYVVTVEPADVATEGRSGRLSVGEEYSAHELLFPLLLESSNDSAAALERSTQKTLTTDMERLALESQSPTLTFADASGLSDQNVGSVTDLARATTLVYQELPQVFDITRLSKRVGPYVPWTNNSPLFTDGGYLGGKHGYTNAAGRTAVALYRETLKPGIERTVGYVVLGSEDLASDIATLRAYTDTAITLK